MGGTISRISGGKFANGAGTGAFQFLFNKCLSGGCKSDRRGLLGKADREQARKQTEGTLNSMDRAAKIALSADQAMLQASPVTDPETVGFWEELGCPQDGTGMYCSLLSPQISVAADYGQWAGVEAKNPAIYGWSTAVALGNAATSACFCGPGLSTATTLGGLLIPDRYIIQSTALDIGATIYDSGEKLYE